MKRVYVNEKWCLACHLCEFNCAFANSGLSDMVLALKGKPIYPPIHVEGDEKISYAVSCRHCRDPICVKSCIAGALSRVDGVIRIDVIDRGCGIRDIERARQPFYTTSEGEERSGMGFSVMQTFMDRVEVESQLLKTEKNLKVSLQLLIKTMLPLKLQN